MKMYLSAKTTKGVTYIPDYIRVKTKDNTEITFDIKGEVDYTPTTLNCRVKGDLIPWEATGNKGNEIDLYNFAEEDLSIMYPAERIYNILQGAKEVTIGVETRNVESMPNNIFSEETFANCKCEIILYINNEEKMIFYDKFEIELSE